MKKFVFLAKYTKQGPCPSKVVHMTEGSVYIRTYSKDQLLSDEVKSHQEAPGRQSYRLAI